MDISPIGNGNYYITVSGEELRGNDVSDLLQKKVPAFTKDAVLEIFTGIDGALIFARARCGRPVVFSFSEIERVISAVEHCESDCVAFLAYEADGYKLLYYPWSNEPPPGALYEFCSSVDVMHSDYQRHVEEQGQLLLGPNAVEQLKEMFR